MDITRKLDYFTFTHHNIKNWERFLPTCRHLDEIGEGIRPLPRYDKAYQLHPAGRVDISEDDVQGVAINLTGGDLTEWIANGISSQAIINECSQYGKITRLDFATDIRQSPYEVEAVWSEIKTLVANGLFKSRLSAKVEYEDKKDGGYTQYFGSYKSDQFIRVYDKAVESGLLLEAMRQHINPPMWTRVELVTKRDFAHNLASDMSHNGWQQAGAAKLRSMIEFPLMDCWRDIVDGVSVELTKVGRKPSKWRKWIEDSVTKSILLHARNQEDRDFLLVWLGDMANRLWKIEHSAKD